jgi:hypothetical protein
LGARTSSKAEVHRLQDACRKAGNGDNGKRSDSMARPGGPCFAGDSVIKLRELRKVARYFVVKNHFGYM